VVVDACAKENHSIVSNVLANGMQAAATVFADASANYSTVEAVKRRLEEWQVWCDCGSCIWHIHGALMAASSCSVP